MTGSRSASSPNQGLPFLQRAGCRSQPLGPRINRCRHETVSLGQAGDDLPGQVSPSGRALTVFVSLFFLALRKDKNASEVTRERASQATRRGSVMQIARLDPPRSRRRCRRLRPGRCRPELRQVLGGQGLIFDNNGSDPNPHENKSYSSASLRSSGVIALGASKLTPNCFCKGMRIVTVVPSPISLRTSS